MQSSVGSDKHSGSVCSWKVEHTPQEVSPSSADLACDSKVYVLVRSGGVQDMGRSIAEVCVFRSHKMQRTDRNSGLGCSWRSDGVPQGRQQEFPGHEPCRGRRHGRLSIPDQL